MADSRPELDLDLYSDEAIRAPFPLYRAIRDRAPAVWLSAHGVYALGRFHDVRAALRADEVLVSGRGVALNDVVNQMTAGSLLASDGDFHKTGRGLVMKPMMPSALRDVRETIERFADALVRDLLGRDAFDGIADFARHLPLAVISHLVGLPESGRERMLVWAQAVFDALGPANARMAVAGPVLREMQGYQRSLERAQVRDGSWAARLFDSAAANGIDTGVVAGFLSAYLAPSLDTTILATGHLLWLLGTHPEQYDLLRKDPERIPAAVDEALRLGSPVRAFSRFAAKDHLAGEVAIPAGERVLILYASANRDERRFADPERFDISRDARDHVAFGFGVHRCAGGHVAQLELESLLRALLAHVRRIEVSDPQPLLNNVLHGHASFRASFA